MLDNTTQVTTLHAEHRDITAGIAYLMKTIEKRNTIPILGNILFPGDGTMQATDLDQVATWRLDGVQGHMPFTVSADSLQRAIKGADAGCLVHFCIEPVDDAPAARIVVSAGGMTSKLVGLPVEDYPTGFVWSNKEHLHASTLRASYMADWLSFVAPCMSTELTRYYLGGIYLHPRNGVLCAVATDGHKLGIKDSPVAWTGPDGSDLNTEQAGVIMPSKAVAVLLSTLGKKPEGNVALYIGKTSVRIVHEKWTLLTKHIDGTFPDYTRVIPNMGQGYAAVDRDAAIKAITRMIGVMGKRGGSLQVDIEGDVLACKNNGEPTTVALAFTEKNADLDQNGVSPEKMLHGFGINPAYLKDTLAAFPVGDVYFSWAEGSPIRFQAASHGWNSSDYAEGVRVAMPMRY